MDARTRLLVLVAVVAAGWLAWSAVVRLEGMSRQFDAHAQLAVVDRVERLGGTYYETGSDQKGPLWLGSYRLALGLTNRRDVWFAVAAMIVGVAAVTGAAVAGILRRWGTSPAVAGSVGVALALHLCFGADEYSHVLYSRNLVIALSAVSLWLLAGLGQRSRGNWIVVVAAGVASGLAVQTNPSAVLTCAVFAGYLTVAARRTRHPVLARRAVGPVPLLPVLFAGSVVLTVGAAPLWYAARGALDDFVHQWWTYNAHYTDATGRSAPQILAKGVADFATYYATHWVQGLGLVAALVLVLRWLPSLDARRALLATTVVGWWLAEVGAVISAQRFFDHYLVLPLVPLAVLAGLGLERVTRLVSERAVLSPGVVGATVVTATLLACAPTVATATSAAATFDSRRGAHEAYVESLAAPTKLARDVVQAHSQPTDYVYLWTNHAPLYTEVERTAATRYVEARWLTGRMYGGRTDAAYVLPRSWQNWQHDITTTEPTVIYVDRAIAVPPGSPFDQLLACPALRRVHEDDERLVFIRTAPLARCFTTGGNSFTKR